MSDNVYLVTGGAGFLGSHLCKRLLDTNRAVFAVDNLSSSTGANLGILYGYNKFEFAEYDVTDDLEFFVKDRYFVLDGIFNLACPASPVFYQNMPIETTLTCVLGAYHALLLAKSYNCKILQASTSEVYGDPTISPQPETYHGSVNCFGPRSCYDEGKRAAEALFYDYKKQYDTDIRVARIFNTYGPNMCVNDGRVVSNFIVQALKNEPITIYGTGTQTRSFCYVDDLINALMILWNSDYTSPVNIGNPDEFNMLELALKILKLTESKAGIKFMDLPIDDPMQRKPDISLIKSLGWGGPKINLDSGLVNTVQYFSKLLNCVESN